MSEREQNKQLGEPGRVLRCDEWESLLADALDGALSAADDAAFARHHRECAPCAQMLKETEQGRSWMQYLAVEPEVPAGLLQKILARTSGPQPGVPAPALSLPPRPAWYRVMLPAVRQAMEPRLMMTLAMAFFSIALTLNLTGVKVTDLRAADFQPSRLRANLTRTYYSTNEQVTKYYKNLRLVYEMESRVRELRRSSTDTEPAPAPQQTPKPPARDGSGSPSSTVPKGQQVPPATDNSPRQSRRNAPPAEMVPAGFIPLGRSGKFQKEVFRALPSTTESQARRSLV